MRIAAALCDRRALRASISPDWTMWVPGWDAIHVDTAVLAFTVLTFTFGSIVFGRLCSVFYTGQLPLNQTLKEGGSGNMSRASPMSTMALNPPAF